MPWSFLNSAAIPTTPASSKLSPPRGLSPFVALPPPGADRLVAVVAAAVVVAVRRLHLEDAVAELEHRDVEGPAAQVEDEDHLVGCLLVEAVGERSGGRLVDDPQHVEAGDLARVLRRLALG